MPPVPQSMASLTQLGQDYAPIAPGLTHTRRTGMEGLPFMSGGGPLAMAGMFLSPQLAQLMAQMGMAPTGAGHDMNVYDVMRNMQYTQQQAEAVRMAAQADRDNYMRTFRGIAALTGTPWGAAQQQAAGSIATTAQTLAPLLVEVAPDLIDQLGGLRGSAAVMSRRIIDAGRYRDDPVTGRFGMSAQTTGELSRSLFRDLYERQDITPMMGVSAGQLGELFGELQSRGMVAGSGTAGVSGLRGRLSASGALAPGQSERMTAEELDRLVLDPATEDRLRNFDFSRVRRSLQTFTGVVAAMRDIFGDAGRPNAPIQELMAGLDTLTMGQASQLDPARLADTARQTYWLAK